MPHHWGPPDADEYSGLLLDDLLADPSHRVDHQSPDRLTVQDLPKSTWSKIHRVLSCFRGSAREESAAISNQQDNPTPSQPLVTQPVAIQPMIAQPVIDEPMDEDYQPHQLDPIEEVDSEEIIPHRLRPGPKQATVLQRRHQRAIQASVNQEGC